jgi:SnoaL-like domain
MPPSSLFSESLRFWLSYSYSVHRLARFHDALRSQFSDFQISPVISLAEADRVCVHWSASFTQTATKKPLRINGTSVVRIENGHFAEGWQNWDAAHLHTQVTGQPTLSF